MPDKNYYKKIENLIEQKEINKKVRELKDNSETLMTYWNIGKLLVQAQGGEKRAKYGNELIKKWSINLVKKYGKGYDYSNLSRFRQFYLCFPILGTVCQELSWSHYRFILTIKNKNKRNYYINEILRKNLSVRELQNEIKNKSYERLSYKDKENIKLITENNEANLTIEDMIKDPIIIKTNKNLNKLNEKVIHRYIIDMLENKFLELGMGFSLCGHEYKIKINNKTFKLDLLFFNIELDAYVVVEVKSREVHPKDIGQLEFYTNYIDKNLKKEKHNKTIGILTKN